MIRLLLMTAVAWAEPKRVVLLHETVRLEGMQQRVIAEFPLEQQAATLELNYQGVKGAGEMGAIAATVTVANAVLDALAPLGIQHLDMPLTPEKVWQAMRAAQA